MKIYRKLSSLYMKKNKSRTLMMFIMVIATVAFMISMDMLEVSQNIIEWKHLKSLMEIIIVSM